MLIKQHSWSSGKSREGITFQGWKSSKSLSLCSVFSIGISKHTCLMERSEVTWVAVSHFLLILFKHAADAQSQILCSCLLREATLIVRKKLKSGTIFSHVKKSGTLWHFQSTDINCSSSRKSWRVGEKRAHSNFSKYKGGYCAKPSFSACYNVPSEITVSVLSKRCSNPTFLFPIRMLILWV